VSNGLLERTRVCVCAGSGGVGKTTTAAALALGAAARGRKVVVVTIDPARRLAESLGVPELGNEALLVDPARLEAAGIEMKGELWALMLDPKRTFDDVVRSYAPDEETREAVLGNRIYRELSTAVAGSQEYMAMERLYELHERGEFDLLVLDTPPSRNALDFLDAPDRLLRFIDSRSLQAFLAPGRAGLRILGAGAGAAMSVLERITGIELLRDLGEFFSSFSSMVDGFRDRAKAVNELLRSDSTTFVLVTTPRAGSLEEAAELREQLHERQIDFRGAIVNRVHALAGPEAPAGELARLLGEDLGARVAANHRDYLALSERDSASLAQLESELSGRPLVTVPSLDDEVHDIPGLARVGGYLFAEAQTGPA
jgi:anion-transporting  ArsA/GET3 family ATPase